MRVTKAFVQYTAIQTEEQKQRRPPPPCRCTGEEGLDLPSARPSGPGISLRLCSGPGWVPAAARPLLGGRWQPMEQLGPAGRWARLLLAEKPGVPVELSVGASRRGAGPSLPAFWLSQLSSFQTSHLPTRPAWATSVAPPPKKALLTALGPGQIMSSFAKCHPPPTPRGVCISPVRPPPGPHFQQPSGESPPRRAARGAGGCTSAAPPALPVPLPSLRVVWKDHLQGATGARRRLSEGQRQQLCTTCR